MAGLPSPASIPSLPHTPKQLCLHIFNLGSMTWRGMSSFCAVTYTGGVDTGGCIGKQHSDLHFPGSTHHLPVGLVGQAWWQPYRWWSWDTHSSVQAAAPTNWHKHVSLSVFLLNNILLLCWFPALRHAWCSSLQHSRQTLPACALLTIPFSFFCGGVGRTCTFMLLPTMHVSSDRHGLLVSTYQAQLSTLPFSQRTVLPPFPLVCPYKNNRRLHSIPVSLRLVSKPYTSFIVLGQFWHGSVPPPPLLPK